MSTSPSRSKFWLIGAFGGALAATFCCLPALLFLVFGTSFGLLSLAAPLAPLRWLLTALALISFGVYVWARFFRKGCRLGVSPAMRRRRTVMVVVAFVVLLAVLFYPEVLGWWLLHRA